METMRNELQDLPRHQRYLKRQACLYHLIANFITTGPKSAAGPHRMPEISGTGLSALARTESNSAISELLLRNEPQLHTAIKPLTFIVLANFIPKLEKCIHTL